MFLTRNDQVIRSPRSVAPSASTSVTAADLVTVTAGACATTVLVDDGADVRDVPLGSVADAVAVLLT